MKIRTKLLLALGSISLIPPIAAYIALINNPRISSALRMNQYETQQGIIAEQLQSDLSVILESVVNLAVFVQSGRKSSISLENVCISRLIFTKVASVLQGF